MDYACRSWGGSCKGNGTGAVSQISPWSDAAFHSPERDPLAATATRPARRTRAVQHWKPHRRHRRPSRSTQVMRRHNTNPNPVLTPQHASPLPLPARQTGDLIEIFIILAIHRILPALVLHGRLRFEPLISVVMAFRFALPRPPARPAAASIRFEGPSELTTHGRSPGSCAREVEGSRIASASCRVGGDRQKPLEWRSWLGNVAFILGINPSFRSERTALSIADALWPCP